MITWVLIENLGIIKKLKVDFDSGFNVITGESGSGKSLIINAISIACGGRAGKELIHPDAQYLKVEMSLQATEETLKKLEDIGIPAEDEIIVRRIVQRNGKSRAYINDSQVTLKNLKEITGPLVEIQRQRESIKLLNSDYQRRLLDRYAGIEELTNHYHQLYRLYRQKASELEELLQREREVQREIDYLNFVVNEIEAASISLQEEEELLRERNLLSNMQRIKEVSEKIAYLLSEGEVNASYLISEAIQELRKIEDISGDAKEAILQLEECLDRMESAKLSILSLSESIEYSEERLTQIEERLSILDKLKRKYGNTLEEVLSFYQEAKQRLEELNNRVFKKESLIQEIEQIKKQLEELAKEISAKRQRASEEFSQAVIQQLKRLNFPNPTFKVKVEPTKELSPWGSDTVTFLFTANPDAPAKPLSSIASGGELARVILAIKSLIVHKEDAHTVILDEVDTGIGGVTAKAVGECLRNIGSKRQVIAITHFPQVAMCAHRHLRVEKILKEGLTSVKVYVVDGELKNRILEEMAGNIVQST